MTTATDEYVKQLLYDENKAQEFIETFFTLPNERGQIVPFRAYPQQEQMLLSHTGRDVTVKGRQTRASSLIMARNVRRMVTQYGLNCVIITQTNQMTQLFRVRIKHHLRDMQAKGYPIGKIEPDNKDELGLPERENRFVFTSAEAEVGLRGVQTAHIVHASEVAHWAQDPGRILGGIIPACPPPPFGWFDIESTPNGAEGLFYDYVMDAKPLVQDSLWTTHFYPWWLEPTYTIESYRGMKGLDVDHDLAAFLPSGDETRLQRLFDLVPAQFLWRRLMSKSLVATGQFFSQEYPEDLMKCFLTAGGGFFVETGSEVNHIEHYIDGCQAAILLKDQLPFGPAKIDFQGPNLQVWEPPKPGRVYTAFMDCAAGFEHSSADADYTCLFVVDAETRHHCATLRLRVESEKAGAMACAVCAWYNEALLGIERNGYGASALQKARELNYPNLYYHFDPARDAKPACGWYTNPVTRDRMLRTLREAVFDHSLVTRDRAFCLEMGSFTWVKIKQRGEGMWRAEGRHHDDMVMAAAGALTIAPYAQRPRRPEPEPEEVVFGPHGYRGHPLRGQGSELPWLR